VVVVNGGPFTLGPAFARGFAFSGSFQDEDVRRIQIVL
jgi:peptidoglycan hydrolase-like protein with peptidoglycan-binding domain